MQMRWYVLGVLILATIIIWSRVLSEQPEGVLTVSFLDVGQGDAALITSPSGNQILIDGGRDRSVLTALGRELSFFDRHIDVIIATHPDGDHIGGLPDVLNRFTANHVFISGNDSDEVLQEVFHDLAGETSVITAGNVINLGDEVYVRVLFPDRDVTNGEPNDSSVIVQLIYGETAFMLTGDASANIEEYLGYIYGDTLESEVLKVGHHGSKTSTSDMFVGLVDPDYGVISAGCANPYGHPHVEVMETLRRFNVEALTTCEEGTISFESDGVLVSRLD